MECFSVRRANRRRSSGAVIAESAASMMLLIPVLIVLLFIVMEAVQAYTINSVLAQAARQAAREIALKYLDDPAIAGSRTDQDTLVYNNIRTAGILVDSAQFEDAVVNTASDPITCTVTVRYLGGQHGLPPFPQCDPLHFGSSIQLAASSTFKTE